ncbi:transcription elongation factor spt4 [Polytolypa hystricis UAMH7299]|uniref:Transcription elongation factor SPT4 n=1 Tax=Polytolypa hystricis (strain UAMH7299) TaxID=1447883 RepID=A0A2B7XMV8_POLH7|nr:transcription elongation factor spt4 [Polytolypa hystricis UAMH7299]
MSSTSFVTPGQQRSLRACMVCSIVQLHSKFMREGCPNCDHVLNLRGNSDAIQECTSQVFEGLIALADERASWVARWQRLDGYVPGTYAVKVTGSLPDEVLGSLEDAGIRYLPYVTSPLPTPHVLGFLKKLSFPLYVLCFKRTTIVGANNGFRRDGSAVDEET